MNKTGTILVGFIAGATAGVVTGIMVAPHKGEKTRRILKDKVGNASKSVTGKVSEQINRLGEKIRGLKHDVEETVETAKHAGKAAEAELKKAAKAS